MPKKIKLFLNYLAVFVLTVVSLNVFENNVWIGEICESSSTTAICDKKVPGDGHNYFLSLSNCKSSLENRSNNFVCARGPDADKPHNTIYSSYREVHFSRSESVLHHDAKWTFILFPLELAAALFLVIILLALPVAKEKICSGKQ